TGPTLHADLHGNIVGRVPPRGEPAVFGMATRPVEKRTRQRKRSGMTSESEGHPDIAYTDFAGQSVRGPSRPPAGIAAWSSSGENNSGSRIIRGAKSNWQPGPRRALPPQGSAPRAKHASVPGSFTQESVEYPTFVTIGGAFPSPLPSPAGKGNHLPKVCVVR